MNLNNTRSRDRRLQVFRSKVEALEIDNNALKKENESLRTQIDKYESVIAQVKDTERQYNTAIADVRRIEQQYSEAIVALQGLRKNYKDEIRSLIRSIKK